VQRNKPRVVAKNYSQLPEIDFNAVFAPVTHLDTVRALIILAAHKGWLLYHLNEKSAFSYGGVEGRSLCRAAISFC